MRDDFAKQLTERERIHHKDHHHNYRRMKMFNNADADGPIGGREPMKARYRIGYGGKTFNENLNPLYGWIRSIVGQKWDKCYSELRQKFDARSVINDHILQHLYQYLETKAYVNAQGKVVVLSRYGRYGHEDREVPIAKSGSDFYVCPKDGTVKISKKPEKRSVIMQRAAEIKRKKAETYREIDARNILRFEDGVWFHYELRPLPKVQVNYTNPFGPDHKFNIGYGSFVELVTWDRIPEYQRYRLGHREVVGELAFDVFYNERVAMDEQRKLIHNWSNRNQGDYSSGLYHHAKRTANKKQLRDAGL
jgi:hypothetical protein